MQIKYRFTQLLRYCIHVMICLCLFMATCFAGGGFELSDLNTNWDKALQIATFDVDVTPTVGYNLAYDPVAKTWDLGLRAKGVVILGAGEPIVFCAVDWISIANEGMDLFRESIAKTVRTSIHRVTVNVLHQHDAPMFDSGAEQIMRDAGLDPSDFGKSSFDGAFPKIALQRILNAIEQSLKNNLHSITHIGMGKGIVKKVASNRNIYGPDGKVRTTRYSSSRNKNIRDEPEGTIDPEVSVISFWNGDTPVAVVSFYATHPQSYYRTGVPNPDFVGVARFLRQLAVPDALHIHFNGAAGDVAAGKYNDGSHENRLILAQRLAKGMKQAWDNTVKYPITAEAVDWYYEPVTLPPAKFLFDREEELQKNNDLLKKSSGNARKIAFLRRVLAGKKIDIACLKLGDARVLFLPGEPIVAYQLAAKAMRPDLFVSVSGYGDKGPGYIGTKKQYMKGGYEVSETASNVAPEVEDVLMNAMKKLLNK